LIQEDYDHFGENAWLAYKAGHDVAMLAASAAHEARDIKQLTRAYAMNAFASHFLSDRFASGHMRTPRIELAASVTPSVVGSLLSGYMHKEENHYGLHVHNSRKDHWMAYGDRTYFLDINAENRAFLQEALQQSADEVFSAYQDGVIAKDDVASLLPYPDEEGVASNLDIATMFYWDAHSMQLFRRSHLANVNDQHWTIDWWGWSTLLILSKQHPLPTLAQAQLILNGYGKEAVAEGLITDKSMLLVVKQNKF